ncbi:uncharacterized protein LOC127838309 isoform X2 [Dreissena polymorpha]|nr:uncharacterized protein LOC127838309 isoform X2 [Dreissena polymorpha]
MCVVFHGLNIKSLHLRGNYRDLNVNHTELLSRSLSSFTHLTELSFELLDYSPDMWKVLNGLNIKYLNLSGLFGGLNLKHLESLLQSISSLGHLEWLRIHIEHFSIGLVKVLHGLNIKSLYLIGMFGGLNIPHVEPFSQSLASLLHLETLSIEVYDDSPGLWDALHGLNIKSMSLNGSFGRFNVKNIESLSQSLASLTQLETLSIYIDEDSPVLWKGLHNLNIKSLSLSGRFGCFNVSHIELLSQSLLSLKQLETFSIYVKTYTEIQLPQSLKYLNVYCWALLPYEVRKLVGTLSARYRTVETNLEFGCASSDASTFERIPLNEYISIQQELETQKHLLVKRFRILDRLCKTDMFDYDVASACSVRGVGEVDDDTQDADSVQEAASERFVSGMSNETINRISIRLQITPALNARIINTCGSKT